MQKLSEYKGEKVFLKELMEHDNRYDIYVNNDGVYMETDKAIKYIAFRKCVNTPTPNVYTDEAMTEKLDFIDIKGKLE